MGAAAFYFDLASPDAYLVAERILHELPLPAPWQPVLAGALGAQTAIDEQRRELIERRARELGLQPLRWPAPFPFESELAMRVATYAQQIGRAVAFAQAAFRQAYAGGRSLLQTDNLLIAAAACEMHPAAVLRAAASAAVADQLRRTNVRAVRAGVREVPAIVLAHDACAEGAPRVFQGPRALEQALAALPARRTA